MLNKLLMLAQVHKIPEVEQPSLLFTPRNGILVVVVVAIIVGYNIYKNKTMS